MINGWFLFFVGRLVRTKLVWYTGSEIRDPQKELTINPYFHLAFFDNYEYKSESAEKSRWVQNLFRKNGFVPIVWDMEQHLLYRDEPYYIIPHTSYNNAVEVNQVASKKVKIVHAPSAKVAKGSRFVIDAIEKLKTELGSQFEFVLLENLPNNKYVQELATVDVLVDQVIWGAYGVAAQQSMEAGVVVVAYLSDDRLKSIYKGCNGVVNANVENLVSKLRELITSPDLKERKQDSVAYFNRIHHPDVVANKVIACIADQQRKNQIGSQNF